jgi:hypothetical protein
MTSNQRRKLMGQVVRFSTVLSSSYVEGRKKTIHAVKLSKPKTGWVVGFSRRLEGRCVYEGYEEGTHFEQTQAVPCVLVRTWPNAKEKAVPLDAIEPGNESDIVSPYRWESNWDEAREDVRKQRCPRCGLFREYFRGEIVEHAECGKEASE